MVVVQLARVLFFSLSKPNDEVFVVVVKDTKTDTFHAYHHQSKPSLKHKFIQTATKAITKATMLLM